MNYNPELVEKLKALHLEMEERDLAAAAAEREKQLAMEESVDREELPAVTPTGDEPGGQEGDGTERATTGMGETEEAKPEPWDLSVVNLKEVSLLSPRWLERGIIRESQL